MQTDSAQLHFMFGRMAALAETACDVPVVIQHNYLKFLNKGAYYVYDLAALDYKFPDICLSMRDVHKLATFFSKTNVSGKVETSKRSVTFTFDEFNFSLSQADPKNWYDETSEITLRPKLTNNRLARVSPDSLDHAVETLAAFAEGKYVSVGWTETGIAFYSNYVTATIDTEHDFLVGQKTIISLENLMRVSTQTDNPNNAEILIESAVNGKNSIAPLTFSAPNIGFVAVVSPMVSEPIS